MEGINLGIHYHWSLYCLTWPLTSSGKIQYIYIPIDRLFKWKYKQCQFPLVQLTRKWLCYCLKTGVGSLAGLCSPNSPKSRCWQTSAAVDGVSVASWRGNAYGKTTVDMGIIARLLNHTSSSSMVYGNWFSTKMNERKMFAALIKMCQNKLKQQVTLLWFSSMNDWKNDSTKRED